MPNLAFPRSPRLDGSDPEAKRSEIRAYFHATFDRYEQLFEALTSDAAYTEKPIPLRHPLNFFYFGHTATFFTNKLLLASLIETRIDPQLESQCAVGVDEMSWDDLDDTHYDWPTVEAVRTYRSQVRRVVDDLITRLPLSLPIGWDSAWWPILMGIEHERIHLETSSVLIRQHALTHVRPHLAWLPCNESGEPPENKLIDVQGGRVAIGKTLAGDTYYGWDNEYGHHVADVAAFRASRLLVSNREFLSFVEAGGYGDDRWWSEEGRHWRDFAKATHPTFWRPHSNGWQLRLMLQEVQMPWNWPVEVNFHEAKAFCSWLADRRNEPVRLPTEDEWYRLHAIACPDETPLANLQLDHWASSCPVDRFQHGEFFDVVGNAWQWTETPIYPFDGFRVHPLYDDFTTPTFDQRHNLFKGGSWISCGNEALPASRYAFRRHFFQHAGFRYVVGEPAKQIPASHYETDKHLSEYAEFHYGEEYFGVPNFSKALADIAIKAMAKRPARKALDLGCAVGRSTFELARHFDHVTGIDFSARFIGLGVQLAEQATVRYTMTEEGDLVSYHERSLRDLGLDGVRDMVAFLQGDACNLKPIYAGFDLILAANLIDRLYSPRKFLEDVHARINPGGLLILASPYTWLTDHTPREEWLGGFKRDGENVTTFDTLKQLLTPNFHLLREPQQVPFVIRETRRKFQHSLSDVSIWERRA